MLSIRKGLGGTVGQPQTASTLSMTTYATDTLAKRLVSCSGMYVLHIYQKKTTLERFL